MKTELKQKAEALFSQYNKKVAKDVSGIRISKTVGVGMFYILDLEYAQIVKKDLTHLEVLKFFDEYIEYMYKLIEKGEGYLEDTPDAQPMREFLANFAELKKEHPFDSDDWNF